MYKVKKQNILMMLKFLINQELQIFHTKEIDNKYSISGDKFVVSEDLKKNRIAERILHWNTLIKKSFDYVVNTPTKDVLKTRLKLIKQTPDCTDVMYEHITDAMKGYLEVSDLGSSEAFIDLMNSKSAKIDDINTFKWNKEISQLEALFNKLKAEGLIDKDYTLNNFKSTLNGGLLSEIKPIEYKCSKSLQVYLYDMLNFGGFISFNITHNKIIEKITAVRGVAQVRNNYNENKSEKPKRSEIIDKIVESL
tara:strand:- start:84 stop:836 length:753 start_codon:yes stop_codon:yes gene_type:complete